jgi:hypothetical protein
MTDVSVATWNLHQAVDRRPANIEATWRFLRDDIRPTVALLQEATVIPEAPGGSVSSRAGDLPYHTAVVAYGGRLEPVPEVTTRYSATTPFAIYPSVPGAFAVGRVVDLPGVEPFVAISLYGRMAPLYAQTSVLRSVADLIPLFDAPPFNRRIVLGGDLNVYDQTTDRVMRARWKAILETVESPGLVNLLKLTQPDRGPAPRLPLRRPCLLARGDVPPSKPTGGPSRVLHDRLPVRESRPCGSAHPPARSLGNGSTGGVGFLRPLPHSGPVSPLASPVSPGVADGHGEPCLSRGLVLARQKQGRGTRLAPTARYSGRMEDREARRLDAESARRARLNRHLRQPFIDGVEVDARRLLRRALTAEELERALRRYPGDVADRRPE